MMCHKAPGECWQALQGTVRGLRSMLAAGANEARQRHSRTRIYTQILQFAGNSAGRHCRKGEHGSGNPPWAVVGRASDLAT